MRGMTTLQVLGVWVGFCAGGPDWDEGEGGGGDAGSVPAGAEAVTGTGVDPVEKISGRLSGFGRGAGTPGGGDFQDMYLIRIADPKNFRATTLADFGGFAGFDAQLFLFKADGTGLIANLNAGTPTTDPLLTPTANDGTGAAVTDPGLYFLAISGAVSLPGNSDGPIFQFNSPFEISGPDGNGGVSPIAFWNAPGETGRYEIALQGVLSIPVGEVGCDPADLAEPFGQHDFSDIVVYVSQFSAGVLNVTDLAPPFGVLDFSDVVAFLTEFADGCP